MGKREFKIDKHRYRYLNAFTCNNKKCKFNSNGLCHNFDLNFTCCGECPIYKKWKKKR